LPLQLNLWDHAPSGLDRPPMRVGPINVRGVAGVVRNSRPTFSRCPSASAAGGTGSTGECGAAASSGGAASSTAPSVGEDLLRMFEESALSDVEVICTCAPGAGCVFKAHRLILAARSPVFKAMFLTGMREKRIGKVVIEDVSPEAIKCMLDYAYKDDCPDLDEDILFDVLKIANKYDMPGLLLICLDFMARNSRSDNSVNFLAACESYNLTEFKHMLLSALVDNPPALHECIHGQSLESHPELMMQLLTLCAHRLSRTTKERHVVKHFDGLPYRCRCYMCVREVSFMSKQMLGEMLFPMVQKICPDNANKITGMIIELDNAELVPLFEFESALREKVEEAVVVLRAAEETPVTSRGRD